jgi:hypothetical protein
MVTEAVSNIYRLIQQFLYVKACTMAAKRAKMPAKKAAENQYVVMSGIHLYFAIRMVITRFMKS